MGLKTIADVANGRTLDLQSKGLTDTTCAVDLALTLKLSPRLRRSLATTNAVESLISRTRHIKRNVKRWRGGCNTRLGAADYVSHERSRPIAITWRLRKPMPDDFFREAKGAAG